MVEEGLGAKVKSLHVPGVARSGKAAELMAWAKIDAAGIVAAVKNMLWTRCLNSIFDSLVIFESFRKWKI